MSGQEMYADWNFLMLWLSGRQEITSSSTSNFMLPHMQLESGDFSNIY
jgi:hypothetical protein